MSSQIDLIKDLVQKDLIVDAVELPSGSRNLLSESLDEIYSRFDSDEDVNCARFIVKVKRSSKPFPKSQNQVNPREIEPVVSFDKMVDETLSLSEKITESRTATQAEVKKQYSSEELLVNAKILLENNEYLLARKMFQTILKSGAFIPESLAGMAQSFDCEGDTARAIRCYQEAIAYSPEYQFYMSLADLQIRLSNDHEASQTLRLAIGIPGVSDIQKFEIHKLLGNCYTRLLNFSSAENEYKLAFELNDKSDALQVNVGSLALQKEDLNAAYKHFQRALEINPKNAKALNGLGLIHIKNSQFADAIKSLEMSLQVESKDINALYNLVKACYESKSYTSAEFWLKKYIKENPININVIYSLAGILFHSGKLIDAKEEALKILKLNPNHSGAKELLEKAELKGA